MTASQPRAAAERLQAFVNARRGLPDAIYVHEDLALVVGYVLALPVSDSTPEPTSVIRDEHGTPRFTRTAHRSYYDSDGVSGTPGPDYLEQFEAALAEPEPPTTREEQT